MKQVFYIWLLTVIFALACQEARAKRTFPIFKVNRQTRIAIIDTGFAPYLIKSSRVKFCKTGHYDFPLEKPGIHRDDIGHGTAMARITNYFARRSNFCIMILNIHSNARRFIFKDDVIARAINHAVRYGAKVINLSLEGPDYSYLEQRAIDNASKKGVRVFVAAGNSGVNLNRVCAVYPACYRGIKNLLTVGALDKFKNRSSYSNYGRAVDIWTRGEFRGMDGTSVSSAAAAGRYTKSLYYKFKKSK